MIYIYYITYIDNMVTYVLAIRDNKLAVGDDNDVLSEVAREGHMQECLENLRGWASR